MSRQMDPRLAARRRAVEESRARAVLGRLVAILGGLATVGGVVWFLQSPFLSADRIVLEGVTRSAAADRLAAAGVVEGRPLLAIRPGRVEAALEEDPWVSRATVSLDWPQQVFVVVEERRPAAWVETAGGWLLMAPDGVRLGVGDPDPALPQVLAPSLAADRAGAEEWVRGALEFLAALGSEREAVVWREVGQVVAQVDGYRVRLGVPTEMTAKAGVLVAVLSTGPEPGSEITVMAPGRPAVLPPTTATTVSTTTGG
jgi:cell division protein FtsQ